MKKVYIPQTVPGRNFTPAEMYGELVFLTPPYDYNRASQFLVPQLKKALQDATEKDYLLLAGDPIAIAICSVILADKNNGQVNFLKWDNQNKVYYEVKLQELTETSYNK